MIRESLQLAQDLLECRTLKQPMKDTFVWAKLVPALLLKAMNDKKFLATEGLSALDSFSDHWSEHYRVFLAESENRNTKIAALAWCTVLNCVKTLGDGIHSVAPIKVGGLPLEPLVIASVKAMLKGKLAAVREHGKGCLEAVIAVNGGWCAFAATYGSVINPKDTIQVLALLPECQAEVELNGGTPAPVAAAGAAPAPKSLASQRAMMAKRGKGAEPTVALIAMPEEDDEEVFVQVKAKKAAQPDTPVGRLRRNSSTPRSRKSEEEILMEF